MKEEARYQINLPAQLKDVKLDGLTVKYTGTIREGRGEDGWEREIDFADEPLEVSFDGVTLEEFMERVGAKAVNAYLVFPAFKRTGQRKVNVGTLMNERGRTQVTQESLFKNWFDQCVAKSNLPAQDIATVKARPAGFYKQLFSTPVQQLNERQKAFVAKYKAKWDSFASEDSQPIVL